MRPDQVDRIEAALKKGFDVLAGDLITIINEDQTEVNVLSILYDLDEGDGLMLDQAGMRAIGIREVIFLKEYLDAQGVTLLPTKRFRIDGDLWDFYEDESIQLKVVPIGGAHNIAVCRLRRSAEEDQSTAGSSWGFQ